MRLGGAKMKKGPCLGVLLAMFFCILYLSPGNWFLSGSEGTEVAPTDDTDDNDGSSSGYTLGDSLPTINFPRPSETINEDLAFRFFDESTSYQTDGKARRDLTRHETALIANAKSTAESHMSQLHPGATLLNGRYRWLPAGVEYDLLFDDPAAGGSSSQHRVTLYQKLEPLQVIGSMQVNQKKVVNMVITLKGRVGKYATFLDHLTKHVLPQDPNLTLTVVYFGDQHLQEARNLTSMQFSHLPDFRWNFVPLEDVLFSRGRGLHLGAQHVGSDSGSAPRETDHLLFFCDVDILMHSDFFSRCRSNSKQHQQVYYPVVFSLYNPSLVYPLLDRSVPPVLNQLTVDEQTGFWRNFGYGMACVYQTDYLAAGGFPDFKSWGGEDLALYKQFLNMERIKVIRAPDPSVFHVYHPKECQKTTDESYVACLKSKVVTEGSQVQLGLMLLKVHSGTDLEGVLSKRIYYFWLIPYLGGLLLVSLLTNLAQAVLPLLTRRPRPFRTL